MLKKKASEFDFVRTAKMASPRQKRVTKKSKETSLPETVALDEHKQKSFETKLKTIKKNVSCENCYSYTSFFI